MKLYNSLTKKLEAFKPLKSGEVKLYTCGPTVYDHQTIGNLRTYVLYDTLKRALVAEDFKVHHVMNITDVGHLTSDADDGEDKLEKSAQRSGKTVWQVAEEYTIEFKDNLKQLNIIEPKYAKATDFVPQQIEMVKTLHDKGFAYITEQAIYFNVTKITSYGKLSGQKLSEKEVGAREEVVIDKNKRHPHDFALWFFLVGRFKHHEMNWPSLWGAGFPGWHIECSAIIHAVLGDPIDIHSGAVDLIGTHHTNEIAQTEAAFENQLANYWIHGEHLLVDAQRMGKSLGNFYTLADIVKRGYEPMAFRLLCLQAHYRTQMNFTWEALDGAQAFLKRLQAWADLKFQPNLGHKKSAGQNYDTSLIKIQKLLADDLNTSQALAVVSQLIAQAEQEGVDIKKLQSVAEKLDKWLGLSLSDRQDIDNSIKSKIAERESARQSKNWQKADELRKQLAEQGIEINDTPHGPVWSRS